MSQVFADLTEDWRKDLGRALANEDDLGIIIRAQILVEIDLKAFIEAKVPAPNELKFDRSGADRILQLALAVGLENEFKGPLRALNRLRNDFAHERGKALTSENAEEF